MNRRAFIAAVAPIAVLAAPASGQGLLGAEGGRLELKPNEAGRLAPRAVDAAAPATTADAPKKKDDEKRPAGPTEIVAREGSLDNKAHQAIFTGEVSVKDPQFNLTCEKLTIHLKQPKPRAKDTPPPPKDAVPAKEDENSESGIDKAVAEGNVVITQDKPDAGGKLQRYVATAKKAIYESDSGTLTLFVWPKVSQSMGGNMTKQMTALEEGCVITMNRAGNISYKGGRAKTTLQSEDAAPKSANAGGR